MKNVRTTRSVQTRRYLIARTLALSALLAAVLAAAAPGAQAARATISRTEPASADDAFLAVKDAVKLGDQDGIILMQQRLQLLDPHYPLYPYTTYWQLSQQLHGNNPPSDEQIRSFVAANEGTLIADLMRRDWLKAIAKRQDFGTFDAEVTKYVGTDDAQLACDATLARYIRAVRRSEEPAEAVLNTARMQIAVPKDISDEGCFTLASQMAVDGRLTSPDIWNMVRLASDANVAAAMRHDVALLPTTEIPTAAVLDQVIDRPAVWLAHQSTESLRSNRELLLIALIRMARNDPETTASMVERQYSAVLAPQARAVFWAETGVAAAKKQMVQASEWCRRSLDAHGLNEDLLSWRVRAALRVQDWALVQIFIERMPDDIRQGDSAWSYWYGRALVAQGKPAEAIPYYRAINNQFNFYGQLATEELGQPLVLPSRAAPPTPAEMDAAAQNDGFARALKFYQLGMRAQANAEWNFALRLMTDRQLLAAAEFARRNEILDRAVNTADRTRSEHDFAQRFPAPFRDQMQLRTTALGLDLDWVYGLIRQESRFVTVARSNVGAQGLMQVMPGTARYVAKKIGMVEFRPGQEGDLETNLTLGTNYLRMVLDRLDGMAMLATAAYNAGPGRPVAWRASLVRPVDGAIFTETIPFNETRDYVKKVMSNAIYYALVFEPGHPQSLKSRLPTVRPEGALASDDLP